MSRVRVRLAELDEAGLVRSIMLAAFGEYAGSLAVESSALVETVDDVAAAMRAGGAVLAFVQPEPLRQAEPLHHAAPLPGVEPLRTAEAVGSARFRPEPAGLYVGRVSVLPAYRRRGVASALMRFLEDVAVAHNRDVMHVDVRDSLPGNVKLYQSLGYEVISIEPHPRGPDRVWTLHKRLRAFPARLSDL